MNLIEGDQFIILASDGVWEFISNEEAANIIMPHYQNNSAEKAAEAIIKEAIKRWQEEDTSIDDITCIIIFLSIWDLRQQEQKFACLSLACMPRPVLHATYCCTRPSPPEESRRAKLRNDNNNLHMFKSSFIRDEIQQTNK